MKNSACLAILCLGAGLTMPVAAWAQQGQQQFGGQQQYGQQVPQQQGQQMQNQQMQGQQLTEQSIEDFFRRAQGVLQQTARTQDPAQLQQYLSQYLAPNATINSVTELYLGNRHVATTIAHATDETVTDALGYAATALQGRKLVSDYNIEIDVEDIQMMEGGNSARVMTEIQEQGILLGPTARRVAQARERMGQMREQMQQGQMQEQGQMQQGWGQAQNQSGMGMGMGMGGGGRGGAPEQGIRFRSRADCTHDITMQQGQIRIGNTFCRGSMRLG